MGVSAAFGTSRCRARAAPILEFLLQSLLLRLALLLAALALGVPLLMAHENDAITHASSVVPLVPTKREEGAPFAAGLATP